MSDDWDSLERARKGDEQAWQFLFRQYYAPLVRMTALITGSLDAAKDLVQETFVRLLQTRAHHRRGTFRAYISTIAYRLALKESTRLRRHQRLEDHDFADETPSPLETVVTDEWQRDVVRVISSLSHLHREVLVLRFYGNHSYEEIAEIIGLSIGTVKSRIFYAVKKCHEKLQKRGIQT